MKTTRDTFQLLRLSALVTVVSLLGGLGCGKKEAAAPAPSSGSSELSPNAVAANQSLEEASQAVKAGDFSRAVTLLTSLQSRSKPLEQEQAALVAQRLRELQTILFRAADGGDAKAKAALQQLRSSGRR